MALNRVSGWSELLDKMGQAAGDREGPPGPTPEPFEVFHLREFPRVVGLLYGLLGSRLVAEELAQETFLVAYRDWDRISGLDNPRAWVRRVAINQRGSFLRAYLRQQTRERDATIRYEDDSIKLADEHAEVWQAIRTLPPLQAQVIALHYYEDYSVAQVAAALGRAPGTIKAQLHSGRRKLARLLGTETDRGRSR
jgi:RNA polymerase sigma-70 factor, ECF subfamily